MKQSNMLKIKLARFGKRHQPHFRIVINEARDKRDGSYVAAIGHYAPTQQPKILELDLKAYDEWLAKGAQPTDTVAALADRVRSGKPFTSKKKLSKKAKAKLAAEKAAKEAPKTEKTEEKKDDAKNSSQEEKQPEGAKNEEETPTEAKPEEKTADETKKTETVEPTEDEKSKNSKK